MSKLKTMMGVVRHPVDSARWAHIALVSGLFFSGSTVAQDRSLSDVSEGLGDQLRSLGTLLVIAFGIGGLFLIGWGLWKLFNRTPQQQDPVGKAIGMVVGGGLLLGMSAVAGIIMGTFGFGSSDDAAGILEGI